MGGWLGEETPVATRPTFFLTGERVFRIWGFPRSSPESFRSRREGVSGCPPGQSPSHPCGWLQLVSLTGQQCLLEGHGWGGGVARAALTRKSAPYMAMPREPLWGDAVGVPLPFLNKPHRCHLPDLRCDKPSSSARSGWEEWRPRKEGRLASAQTGPSSRGRGLGPRDTRDLWLWLGARRPSTPDSAYLCAPHPRLLCRNASGHGSPQRG